MGELVKLVVRAARRDQVSDEIKQLRNEIEAFISAGASDAELRARLPLNSRNLLAVVRKLVDEVQLLVGVREQAEALLKLGAYPKPDAYNEQVDVLKEAIDAAKFV